MYEFVSFFFLPTVIFEQVDAQGGILGALDTSFNLYKTVYPSVRRSVHQSVRHASANINENQQFFSIAYKVCVYPQNWNVLYV